MKWVDSLRENKNTSLPTLHKAVKRAEKYNLNYATFQGEILSIKKLYAIIEIIEDTNNDKIHRESDTTTHEAEHSDLDDRGM